MPKHTPLSLDEIRKIHAPIKDVNAERNAELSRLDRIAVWVTEHVGTMGFFLVILGWTILWLGWNVLAPSGIRFDPAPAFVLWLFISNMIQIFLMPLLMIGQNLQGRHSELRAEADFAVNRKSEQEIEAILMHLENQDDTMLRILQRLDGPHPQPLPRGGGVPRARGGEGAIVE